MVLDMYRRPRDARKFLQKVSDSCFGIVKQMIDAGIEVLFITDDIADNRTPFFNPEMFRKFIVPNIRRVTRLARRRGVRVVKHTDGNIHPIMEDMIKAGIEGIHPIEPGVMDLGEAKQMYGDRIALVGNVDCRFVVPMGSEQDVRRDVRRCIDAAADGGGYILASSNSLHANSKVPNVFAMLDEARRSGAYPS
jgi:uroporphyrinogen decarboxylase